MSKNMLKISSTMSKRPSQRNSLFGGFEPKSLNLVEECAAIFPNRQWSELTPKEQTEVIRRALQADTILLNPHSEYIKYWDLLIAVALLFTSIITPYEVVFTTKVAIESWLFWFNRLIDIIFVKDMIMQFFLKVEVRQKDRQGGKTTLKDPGSIRWRYLTTWFPIDFISVLPFDVVFLLYDKSSAVSGIKILRMARLLRLIKLIRILRSSRLIIRWQNHFAISFAFQKLAKFGFMLVLFSHWMACAWGLAGITLGKDMCDEDGQPMYVGAEPLLLSERSWVTKLFESGTKPDNPCEPWHLYITSLYWSVMTITSIGYGDITPVRNEEYMVCVLCMLLGGVLWAYIIGSLCGVMANGDPVESNFESNMDLLNLMMSEARVPVQKRQLYREYLREAKVYDQQTHFREIAQGFSPMLKGSLLTHVSSVSSMSIFYLKNAPETCFAQMLDSMSVRFYSRREKLLDISDHLCLIERGTMARGGKIITPGMAFQIDFIVTNPDLRKHGVSVALTYCLVSLLSRDRFFEIIQRYPDVAKEVSKAAVKLALMRVVVQCAEVRRDRKPVRKGGTLQRDWVSLMQAFRTLHAEGFGMHSTQTRTVVARTDTAFGERSEGSRLVTEMSSDGQVPEVPELVLEAPEKVQSAEPARRLDAEESLDALEATLVASLSAAQEQLANMQQQLEELRSTRLQITI
mmetsp:Transcript_88637/g.247995  ORF Transcript_88637/g.247995 Transcript_88637/m.247995 type:complete len:688 (+) Transcript_88637:95-2158(+)